MLWHSEYRKEVNITMNICVIGTGYVGLVTGTILSDLGNHVHCVDKDIQKIAHLRCGKMPIYEPGLEEIVCRNHDNGRLHFSTDLMGAVRRSDIIFICVGTPPKEDGNPEMGFVEAVAKEIAVALNGYKIIVNKSTVPIGTAGWVTEIIEQNRLEDHPFDVVSNPEFLREGSAIHDTLHPDRVVIGAPKREVAEKVGALYTPLQCEMLYTDVASAEMIKYASNSFLATKISFINAIANLCEYVGADVEQVALGMGKDRRIGQAFLNAGLGYGGSCFPKDCSALYKTAEQLGYDFSILRSVMEVNTLQPHRFLSRFREALGGSLKGKQVGILGLAFKPNTDDIRDSKALEIVQALLLEGAIVQAYDPIAMENTRHIYPQIGYCESPYGAAKGADGLLVVTDWQEFAQMDLGRIKRSMKTPVLFDGRNMFCPETMQAEGFAYECVGRTSLSNSN